MKSNRRGGSVQRREGVVKRERGKQEVGRRGSNEAGGG